jgi:hypothetical protein
MWYLKIKIGHIEFECRIVGTSGWGEWEEKKEEWSLSYRRAASSHLVLHSTEGVDYDNALCT